MKRILLIAFLIISIGLSADFPEKPVRVIVYTGPGGLIDITARKFIETADLYTDATMIVENVPGAGGLVAIRKLLQSPADGYTLLACTKSNISKLAAAGSNTLLDSLYWAGMLIADPECIITSNDQEVSSWDDLIIDAVAENGSQIWVGPAAGGLDHVMALKTWKEFGILAKWIPYKSGGKAVAALMGGMGVAYVGNPRDTFGKPQLKITAISSAERLAQFPDVPTFRELGAENLDNEYMWRGFALRRGVQAEILNWYDELFRQVNADSEWREYWEKGGIEVDYQSHERFTEIVHSDFEEFSYYLRKLGLLSNEETEVKESWLVKNSTLGGYLLLFSILIIGLYLTHRFKGMFLNIWIPLLFIFISLLYLLKSFGFATGEEVGPEIIPRLWIFLLVPLSLYILITGLKEKAIEQQGSILPVLRFIVLLAGYIGLMQLAGYFISTIIFLAAAMLMLGYRKYPVLICVSLFWTDITWLVFDKLLNLNLPGGIIF